MFENELRYYAALVGYYNFISFMGKNIFKENSRLDIKEIQETFNKLISSNNYCDEFIDILYPKSEYFLDFFVSLKIGLEKLGIEIPKNYQEAVCGIVRYHLTFILEGNNTPVRGMLDIAADIHWKGDYDVWSEYDILSQELGLSKIICEISEVFDYCWAYRVDLSEPELLGGLLYKDDDGEEVFFENGGEAIEFLNKDILKAAWHWLKNHQ